jgi:hypothetical protein
MTTIRVSAPSVRSYGAQAQDIFGEIHTSLGQLVNDVTHVHYIGPNAAMFKAKCGQIAADFANKMHTNMSSMAEAVRASTSNIANSLGGSAITISVEARPFIVAPAEKSDGELTDVDTTGLEALTPLVNQRFAAIREGLASHLSALQATDWAGQAKDGAVSTVSAVTRAAQNNCQTTQTSITDFIASQLESVLAADKPIA